MPSLGVSSEATATPEVILRALLAEAVASAMPELVLPGHLPPPPKGRTVVVGGGKASAAMAFALQKVWPGHAPISGLVITRYGHVPQHNQSGPQSIEIVQAGHPVPDDAGLAATSRMLDLVRGLTQDDLVIALISGGASALMVAPVDGLTLSDKRKVNKALIESGAPISEMNLVRKHLSRVKGGQLAAAAWPARVLGLIISDVPGDDVTWIGSGPTVGDDSTPTEARAILDKWNISVPQSVHDHLRGPSRVIPTRDRRLSRIENRIVAAPSQALAAAQRLAQNHGCDVKLLGDDIEGEAREVAREHSKLALALQAGLLPTSRPLILLSGGELTVTRTGQGIGGPNAEYCLALALALQGAPGIHALAADTDGVDGAAEIAGAMIGPSTLKIAAVKQFKASDALDHNDAHSFFGAIGTQVVTGPTLTNVNDFRAIWIEPVQLSSQPQV